MMMARCRRTPPMTTLLLLVVVGIALLLQPAKSFSTNRQLERLLGKLSDVEEEDAEPVHNDGVNRVSKRENKGTCTCTCETRQVSPSTSSDHSSQSSGSATSGIIQHPAAKLQSENRVPESASLLRTATAMTTKDAKLKPQQSQQQQQTRGDSKSSSVQQKTVAQKNGLTSDGHGHGAKQDYELVEQSINSHGVGSEPETADQEYEDVDQQDQDQARQSQQETWSLGSRYPWERLPDNMCFRESCSSDRDCCRRFNICDRSAHVCVDCWYGSTCTSERDCCLKYKYCQREWKPNPTTGKLEIVGGKCVSEL